MPLLVARECKRLCDKINGFLPFISSEEEAEARYQYYEELYEYLQLVGTGIDSYIETHPVPNLNNNNLNKENKNNVSE
ncbi:MAG: hypothetical protein IJS45_11495 [Clostridia bacterium]|nr:hypothetical protein [Clostridia bacterium]